MCVARVQVQILDLPHEAPDLGWPVVAWAYTLWIWPELKMVYFSFKIQQNLAVYFCFKNATSRMNFTKPKFTVMVI